MLSHKRSGASDRLRRAKSSASMSSRCRNSTRPQGTDPETASQDAVIAASQAFERANERYRERITNDLLLYNNTLAINAKYSQSLSRQPSIRFKGTAAIDRRQSIQTRDRRLRRNDSTATGRTTASSISRAETYIEMSKDLDNTNTPEDDVASTQSSYRRVRKSRSLFSTRGSNPVVFSKVSADGSPGNDQHNQLKDNGLSEKTLRTPKSMSFLRGYDYLTPSIRRRNDAAVAAARDRYLLQVQQQQLKKSPSLSLIPGTMKRQKIFRKSVRTTSLTSYGNAISSPNQDQVQVKQGLGAKARRISFNLTNKFKRVFQKNTHVEDAVPLQHIEAGRDHFGDYNDTTSPDQRSSCSGGHFDDVTSSQTQSRVPSLHVVQSVSPFRGRNGSQGAIFTEDDQSNGKSRVTSWTDSTAANTLATREAVQRKRLSIIKEFRSPNPTTSYVGSLRNNEFPSGTLHPGVEHDRSPGPVDSQRVYSALQKCINKSERGHEATSLSPTAPIENNTREILGRSVSISSRDPHRTIRKVDRNGTLKTNADPKLRLSSSVVFRPGIQQDDDDIFTTKTEDSAEEDHGQYPQVDAPTVRSGSRLSNVATPVPKPASHQDLRSQLTPQEIANRYEALRPSVGNVLREAKSSFFPYSPGNQFVGSSPYRRALGASMSGQEDMELQNTGGVDRNSKLEERSISRDYSTTESESLYSRTTSGNDPVISGTSEPVRSSEELPGTAVFITDRKDIRVQHKGRTSASPEDIDLAHVSSKTAHGSDFDFDWINPTPRPHGHTRESAQIDDEDVDNDQTTRQLVFDSKYVFPRPILKNRSSVSQFGQEYKSTQSSSTVPMNRQENISRVSNVAEPPPASVLQEFNQNVSIGRAASRVSTRSATYASQNAVLGQQRRAINSSKFTEHLDETFVPNLNRARSTATLKLKFAPSLDASRGNTNDENRRTSVSNPAVGAISSKPNDDAFEDYYDKLYGSGKTRDSAPQAANSRMVDIFLSSRRRRMRMSDDNGTVAFV
jgi:hypothetical protein